MEPLNKGYSIFCPCSPNSLTNLIQAVSTNVDSRAGYGGCSRIYRGCFRQLFPEK